MTGRRAAPHRSARTMQSGRREVTLLLYGYLEAETGRKTARELVS